ncbi:MAG: phosphatidylglycerophosphatase A [Sedimentisphaerales bacterium]|nr:phosphatidylglycerophosphatase A [Sedimentisphaerales bacterium]
MKRLLTSCFGLGRLPVAPGTYGSVPAAVIFDLLGYLGASPVTMATVMAAIILAAGFICVKFAPSVIAATGKNDPGEVVADELAGQAVTFLFVAAFIGEFTTGQICITTALGFLLFRLFDISKPWPIRKLEKFPAGWGILADDLLAGVYGGIALLLCYKTGVITYISELCACGEDLPLGVVQAVILGIVQGATEFLPVSSSGHLVLFENLFKFDPETPAMLLFDLCVHVGTVAAIFIVFRKSISNFVKNLLSSGKYGKNLTEIYQRSPSVHILVLAILATAVTGVPGILLEKYFSAARGNLKVVAFMWLITGTLLLITDRRKKTRMGLRRFGAVAAIIVGLAQLTAIMPGISRSGATICAAILIGLHRRWAVEFSFLLAIPAILVATLVQAIRDFSEISSGSLPVVSVLAGTIAAAVTGIFALKLLIRASRSANLKYFAFYCYILGAAVLLFYLLR